MTGTRELMILVDSLSMVLGKYLDHIAWIEEEIDVDVRETARIGTDIIAASMQYDHAAKISMRSKDNPLPLASLAMTRSSIYGLHYLWNLDKVQSAEKLRSISNFLNQIRRHQPKNKERKQSKGVLARYFGDYNNDRYRWNRLSEYVHIIPELREGRESIKHHVDFRFNENLDDPTIHAGLPKHLSIEAEQALEWRARLALSCYWGFQKNYSYLFRFENKEIQNHLKNEVWVDCKELIMNTPIPDDLAPLLEELSDVRLFNPYPIAKSRIYPNR